MNKIASLFIAIITCISLFAQTPNQFKYQAVVRDATGQVITNQNVNFRINILIGSPSGGSCYSEIHSATTNQFGLVNLEIGNGTTTQDFSTIDWGSNSYFIQIEVDIAGGTSYQLMGTSQLLSVPYALHAKTAENVTAPITENDPVYNSSAASNITATDITNLSNISGINTGDQDLSKLAMQTALEDTASAIRIDFPNVSGLISTETDPVFNSSVSSGITATDTSNWNSKLENYVETDPTFAAWDKSTGVTITESQISNLKNYLTTEVDGDVTNELQVLSISNDTIYLTNGGFVKLPSKSNSDI